MDWSKTIYFLAMIGLYQAMNTDLVILTAVAMCVILIGRYFT